MVADREGCRHNGGVSRPLGQTPSQNATLENVRFPPRAKRTSVVAWRPVATYEYAPSMRTQKEEKRAVMGLELLWAVCGLKDEAEAPRWGGV
jgi:hypothetical protein